MSRELFLLTKGPFLCIFGLRIETFYPSLGGRRGASPLCRPPKPSWLGGGYFYAY